MKEVLSRVIPVLGSIKDEPMKWAFTTGTGNRFICLPSSVGLIVHFWPWKYVGSHVEFSCDFSIDFRFRPLTLLSSALGRFAEAAQHFAVNASPAQRVSVPDGCFGTDMNMAFDVIFTNWLGSKEIKVRLAVLESLGVMGPLLTRDHFDAKLALLLPAFLGMYKKEAVANHLPITQGLGAVFAVACSDQRSVLEKDLPIILG
jgi:hypothetical protein